MDIEAKKKGEVTAAAKCEKHSHKRQAKKKQMWFAGKEEDVKKLADP